MAPPVDDAGFAQLAALRAGLRRYLAWAEQRAREHGMTPAQVQLALAIRAHDDPAGPTLTELAETLLLRHHSVVGLVDRLELEKLVSRRVSDEDRRQVLIELTAGGESMLAKLAAMHRKQLQRIAPELSRLLDHLNSSDGA